MALAEPLGQGSPGCGSGGSKAGDLGEWGGSREAWQQVSNKVRGEGKQNMIGAALSSKGAPKSLVDDGAVPDPVFSPTAVGA